MEDRSIRIEKHIYVADNRADVTRQAQPCAEIFHIHVTKTPYMICPLQAYLTSRYMNSYLDEGHWQDHLPPLMDLGHGDSLLLVRQPVTFGNEVYMPK